MLYKTFLEFKDVSVALPHRLLCLDIGSKTVGASVSDRQCTVASPLKTVLRKKGKDFQELKNIVTEYEVVSFVIGYPLHFNGDAGERCAYVIKYMEALQAFIPIPALLWDERMSTTSAERVMLEGDLSRSRRKESIDAVAASIILQSFLDFLRYQRQP